MKFKLALNGKNGFERQAIYDPEDSSLIWADSGESLPLPQAFPRQDMHWQPFWHVHHPNNPAGKSRAIRHLKLQLGLKCNYACQYCSQAHQPHDIDGHPEDVLPFMQQLEGWFAGGEDGQGAGVKIEFWGGEPFVYWKLLKPLGEAVKARYPNAQLQAKQEQHVADVRQSQLQISQEISNEYAKRSKLLADRQPDARSGGVCNVPPTGGRDLPAVPETPAGAAPARSDHLLASSGDAGEMSCEQLSKDAAQTTLMLVEVQRWYREQSVIEP